MKIIDDSMNYVTNLCGIPICNNQQIIIIKTDKIKYDRKTQKFNANFFFSVEDKKLRDTWPKTSTIFNKIKTSYFSSRVRSFEFLLPQPRLFFVIFISGQPHQLGRVFGDDLRRE